MSSSCEAKETLMDENSHGQTTAGVELTDEVLDTLAKEAENGFDVSKLRASAGPPCDGLRACRVAPGATRS